MKNEEKNDTKAKGTNARAVLISFSIKTFWSRIQRGKTKKLRLRFKYEPMIRFFTENTYTACTIIT